MSRYEDGFCINEVVVLVGSVALIAWVCSERLIQLLGLRQPEADNRERLSWYLHIVTFYGAVVFPFLDATYFHWSTVGPSLAFSRWIGVPFLLAGIAIRILSRLTLGKQFSGHVQTTHGHRLVTTGIYRSIRHPAYLGYFCLLLGFPLCFGSIGGLACAIAFGVPALLYRIRIEEAALETWFSEEYTRYQATTRKLIPGLW